MTFSYALAVAALCVVVPPLVILYRIVRVRVPARCDRRRCCSGRYLIRGTYLTCSQDTARSRSSNPITEKTYESWDRWEK